MARIKLIIVLLGLLVWSCDKPDDPYLDGQTDLGTAAGVISYGSSFFASYESTVLLEDFTGFKCQNCGPALAAADALQEQWGDRIIVVGYHVLEFFAAPDNFPQPPDSIFSKDFRTDEGEALADEYGILSLPQGLVNRKDFGSGARQLAGDWPGLVSDEMSLNAKGFVEVITDSVSLADNAATFAISLRPLAPVEEDWNLVVGIYENNIIEGQKDGNEILFPFSHQHVFRKYVNGRAGQTVITSDLNFASGDAIYYKFTTDLDSEWAIENCYLFAFLQNSVTLEVYAVSKAPLS
ncbi:MAG: Omp28-related outer membrane protein [Cryomorphaceae bacterium]